MPARLGEPFRLKPPDALPALLRALTETGLLHDAQVLGDRLPRHREARGQPRDRRRSLVAQARDEAEPRLVSQSEEHGGRVREVRLRAGVTPSGQGASRSASSASPSRLRSPRTPWPAARAES